MVTGKKFFRIILFGCMLGVLNSCIPVRHFFVTSSTQKWEKEHFNPERKGNKKKKKSGKRRSKGRGLGKRIG